MVVVGFPFPECSSVNSLSDLDFVSKDTVNVEVVEHAGYILKFGLIDLFMGCILTLSNGELMQLLLLF